MEPGRWQGYRLAGTGDFEALPAVLNSFLRFRIFPDPSRRDRYELDSGVSQSRSLTTSVWHNGAVSRFPFGLILRLGATQPRVMCQNATMTPSPATRECTLCAVTDQEGGMVANVAWTLRYQHQRESQNQMRE